MSTSAQRLAIAQSLLLSPYGLETGHLHSALSDMFVHDLAYADIYLQYTRSESWALEEGQVKSGQFSIDQGVGVRAVVGDKTAFAYSDEIGISQLRQAAQTTRAIARQGQQQRIQIPSLQPSPQLRDLYLPNDPLQSIPSAVKITLLEKLEKMAQQLDERIIQVMVNLSGEYDVVLVARYDGVLAADVRPLVRIGVRVIMQEADRRESGSASAGGRWDYTQFDDYVLMDLAKQAVDEAETNLAAEPAPAGEMTVVLGSGWPGILLHEAIGHGLEADFNRKGTSAFSDKIGQRVAAKGVSVVDDGTLAQRRGSLNIDDEGNSSQCTPLIEDGILKGYLHDSMSARLMDCAVTGNARRESYAHIPMPRMTNTYMQNGVYPPEEIIASVKRGLYAVNFAGGQVDITNGKFVFSTSEAWMIEDGQLSYPVKGATLIGNGPDVLTKISMVGNDMRLDSGIGVCGKEGQSVPVGVGQPTLKIDTGLTVGGVGV